MKSKSLASGHHQWRSVWSISVTFGSILLLALLLSYAAVGSPTAYADPIAPPEGYPKLSLSSKTVDPPVAHTGGAVLYYAISLQNTGAYTASHVILTDVIPEHTTYNGDLAATVPFTSTYSAGTLAWHGDVGFDTTVVVSFSVTVADAYSGPGAQQRGH